jgi:Spy/CpxP family protein refolding chaperone
MNSRIALTTVITVALTAGGLMAKQDNGFAQHRHQFAQRMSAALNLTPEQQQQAKSIFKSEREAARPVREQLRQDRKAVEAAIQSGNPVSEVQQLAKREGPALGEMAGMRATAFAKFYAILTPAQQQKLASMRQQWREHRAEHRQGGNQNGETR